MVKGTCFWCGCEATLTRDHLIPQSVGGGDGADNIVMACAKCNLFRGVAIYNYLRRLKIPKGMGKYRRWLRSDWHKIQKHHKAVITLEIDRLGWSPTSQFPLEKPMKRYCLGFAFNGNNVLLIRKNRPIHLAGLWNGIGGLIHPDESAIVGMARETKEEVDLLNVPWMERFVIHKPDCDMIIFVADHADIGNARTMTDEVVSVFTTIPDKCVPNLQYLLPMCFETRFDGVQHLRYK